MGRIGIIGGSGLYKIEGLKDVKEKRLSTPFGNPSDAFLLGVLEGRDVVFLPRHGRGHNILPSEINYKANIYGMKMLGVERIVSVGAVGSFKKELKPLDILVVDQFVDRTNQARKTTFFGDGIVAHISFAEPVCRELSKVLYESGREIGATMHNGGTYLNMEGPAFSTLAESNLYRGWGMDVIGMTNMPEARLARESEMCYSTLAMVTDYDCWCMEEGVCPVSVDIIIQNLSKNVDTAKRLIKNALNKISHERTCPCKDSLRDAIITPKNLIPAKRKKDLEIIIGRYLSK